jgi:hypothetical protein
MKTMREEFIMKLEKNLPGILRNASPNNLIGSILFPLPEFGIKVPVISTQLLLIGHSNSALPENSIFGTYYAAN